MTNDVAIIGVGLHPFGRFDKTAMETVSYTHLTLPTIYSV